MKIFRLNATTGIRQHPQDPRGGLHAAYHVRGQHWMRPWRTWLRLPVLPAGNVSFRLKFQLNWIKFPDSDIWWRKLNGLLTVWFCYWFQLRRQLPVGEVDFQSAGCVHTGRKTGPNRRELRPDLPPVQRTVSGRRSAAAAGWMTAPRTATRVPWLVQPRPSGS